MSPANTEPPPGAELHSIGDAAEAAGLTPQALRMWEDRYGRPVAVRLPSGHRRYTDEQVRWLRRVAEALGLGHRAGAVVAMSDDDLTALLATSSSEEELGEGPTQILTWLRAYGIDEIRAWLDTRWDPDSYLTYLKEEIAPLIAAVGRGWADGELDVAHEHFLSELLEDELRRRRGEFPLRADAPTILFATLPGELHGLGLQMAALGAAAHGLRAQILGVNTPLDSIVGAAQELEPAAVCIGVSASSASAESDRMLAQLRTRLPASVQVIAGGAGMQRARRSPKGVKVPKDLAAWDKLLATFSAA